MEQYRKAAFTLYAHSAARQRKTAHGAARGDVPHRCGVNAASVRRSKLTSKETSEIVRVLETDAGGCGRWRSSMSVGDGGGGHSDNGRERQQSSVLQRRLQHRDYRERISTQQRGCPQVRDTRLLIIHGRNGRITY